MNALFDREAKRLDQTQRRKTELLDSAHGEQFGDEVLNAIGLGLERAINCVIAKWMGRTVDEQTAKTDGIRPGPSYLMSHLTARAIEVRMFGDLA
ncbi:hypothetical protein [Ralstonia solanacearum]|uniref:Uncharacterized protein n=1 Tax=Ralstonia solanacearum TaxID=305 RepID=A0AAE3T6B1_RALSL|nr:hypothetical protein [Ralstonia solanacearum]MDB0525039.1 hypothetical protein [Ralstonia solanacearum]